jgi:hypothetical protein
MFLGLAKHRGFVHDRTVKTVSRIHRGSGSLRCVAILLLCGLTACGEGHGGMRSSYNAKDFDLALTKNAATATPIISAAHHYRRIHGTFPPDLASFQNLLPKGTIVHGSFADDWAYVEDEKGSSFKLITKLGWDPSLVYEEDATNSTWTFDPGDGSKTKVVKLAP